MSVGSAKIRLVKVACAVALNLGVTACEENTVAVVDPAAPTYTAARITLPTARSLKVEGIPGEERVLASLLNVPGPMKYGQSNWNEDGVQPGKTWVLVNLDAQTISVFRGAHEIGTAVALYGVDGKPTPLGRFRVLEMRKDHQSSIYEAEMPFTLKLTNDGIAIHGSDVRSGIGTHGCVGIPLEFASKLFGAAHIGTEVLIVRSASNAPKLFPSHPTS